MNALRRARRVLIVLWAGSLWSLALWIAPLLFHVQPDRHLAGDLAARYFTVETWLGIAAAGIGLALPGRGRLLGAYGAVLLLAINEWVLKRFMSVARIQGAAHGLSFGAWHGVSAVLYVIACVLVLLVVWKDELR